MAGPETYDALMKIVIIGDTAVGKTCMIMRYTHDTFRQNFLSTIGVDFKTKKVVSGSKTYRLQIWDTAGQERYNTIRKNFYRGAKGIVVVYDICNVDSFQNVTRWLEDVETNVDVDEDEARPTVLILANKIDLEDERVVATSMGEQMAQSFGALFAEVSAKSGEGVPESFDTLVKLLCQRIEKEDKVRYPDQSIKLHTRPLDQTDSPNSDCSC